MSTESRPRRALLSAYDKTGVVELGAALVELGWELVSSGGTAKVLADAGLPVIPSEQVTGFGEMLGHRVVTLHPMIHGGILADRDDPSHVADMEAHGVVPIDLVAVNLYPFRSDPSVELIDIGGPAMVRGAAKNHAHVTVLVDPADYQPVLEELRANGEVSATTRRRLARDAFAHTAAYDSAIVAWFDDEGPGELPPLPEEHAPLPRTLHLSATLAQPLRYGENPHQVGARYSFTGDSCWDSAVLHGGKEMSYLNVYDADAAWRLVHSLGDEPAAVIIKHANPCGAAVADDITTAYVRAHECDPTSAFGGIVAVNRTVPVEMAKALAPIFTEVVIAPGYDDDALMVLLEKRNLRVLTAPPPTVPALDVRSVDGGLLVQTKDVVTVDRSRWQVVTERQPTEQEWADLEFAWRLCARVTSNTIVLVKDGQAFGIGAGQQSRVDAAQIAGQKAAGRADGGAGASDAFFPFRDGLDSVADQGVTAVIQPGGSIRDEEVVAAADERGLAMVMTGERHFKH
ncbi:bifunctional phosphoribosylaminoimidazolecarboxamide formyltransferase/IMP cyclohydrolase [Dermatobacter hominis]|uniref:bifunctional phosphoribosylaminoimidazolecarboxamide formyltransferase/IMP cyclohydrolase n=1 Tax=Dermatobacter hominis TaxID=2884263 RepID=UPI001D110517|nr:bifunctional phosphoribosylaminoimidazolecarboxamide formyltransferase/IMP cyclohydrolase [Dermatobacter hominis]UDY37977.1 bifunctional phosphoribosylaminoimidazolecarboxamide formyltransferase/IMP cyclohydrolase [Dermatobacter hominis]